MNESENEKERYKTTLYGVFRNLVWRRFGGAADLRVIVQFLAAQRRPVFPDKRFPFLEAEALIRSALGERGLVEGISVYSVTETRLQLLVYLAEDLGLDRPGIDDLIADVEDLAA
jgi:hypothetical protein